MARPGRLMLVLMVGVFASACGTRGDCERQLAHTVDALLVQGGDWTLAASGPQAQAIHALQAQGRGGLQQCGGTDLRLEFRNGVSDAKAPLGALEVSAVFNDPVLFQAALAGPGPAPDDMRSMEVLELALIFGGPDVRRAAVRTFRGVLADTGRAESIRLAAAGNVHGACDALRDLAAEAPQAPREAARWVSLEEYLAKRGVDLASCGFER